MPYNFQAGGANDAILQVLAQRRQEEQQALVQKLAQQQQAEQNRRADAQLKLQQEQEARIASAQKAAAEDLATNRRGARAANVYENQLPGVVDPKTATEQREFGYGGVLTETPVTQGQPTGAMMPGQEDVPLYDVVSGHITSSGGSKYQTAKQLATDKADAAKLAQGTTAMVAAANAAAAKERNDADNQTRRELTALIASGQGNTTDLKRQLLQLDIDKKTGEAKSLKDEKAAKLEAVRAPAQEAADVLDSLLDMKTGALRGDVTPVVGWGASIPGHTAIPSHATAISRIDRLKSLLVVDLMGQMKKQSRTGATGFGALSGPELAILEASAGRLARTQTEASFTEELHRLREKLEKVLTDVPEAAAPGAPATAPAAGKRIVYGMDGKPVTK